MESCRSNKNQSLKLVRKKRKKSLFFDDNHTFTQKNTDKYPSSTLSFRKNTSICTQDNTCSIRRETEDLASSVWMQSELENQSEKIF